MAGWSGIGQLGFLANSLVKLYKGRGEMSPAIKDTFNAMCHDIGR